MDLFVGVSRILARCFWIEVALKLGFLRKKIYFNFPAITIVAKI